MREIDAVLIDIDGVLTVSWRALQGAPDAVKRIRDAGLHLVFLTNTTSRSRNDIATTLTGEGFEVHPQEILSAPVATAAYLRKKHPQARCFLLNSGDIAADLPGVHLTYEPDEAELAVLGGAGTEFGYESLNQVLRLAVAGAPLIAMHRSLTWRTDVGLQLDTGAFLLTIEEAAGVEAVVVGKPAAPFFQAALDQVGVAAANALMVGDDIESDVLAAQTLGITGVLVRTGKYRAESLTRANSAPDHVLDSFHDLPTLLRLD